MGRLQTKGIERHQQGSVLLVALVVLAVSGIMVTTAYKLAMSNFRHWKLKTNRQQALYLAESGIAHQLYLEQWKTDSDSGFTPLTDSDVSDLPPFDEPDGESESTELAFMFNKKLPKPSVVVEEESAYLAITSKGTYNNIEMTVEARFGRALTDSIFGSALISLGEKSLTCRALDNVQGRIYVKNPLCGEPEREFRLSSQMAFPALLGDFAGTRDNHYQTTLNEMLAQEGSESGNGYFNSAHLPNFKTKSEYIFPLGDVHIENLGGDCLHIKGPGAIYAHGDIYVRGCVSLEDVILMCGRSIQFDDSVSSRRLSAYSGRNIYIRNRSHLGIEAVAQEDIVLEDQAQTTIESVLLSIGAKATAQSGTDAAGGRGGGPKGGGPGVRTSAARPSGFGIHLKGESMARGLLIAASGNGTLVLTSERNRVEGIALIKHEAWIKGTVNGTVITGAFRCNENPEENCLGEGRINRNLMPAQMALPFELGGADRSSWAYKLVSWRLLQ